MDSAETVKPGIQSVEIAGEILSALADLGKPVRLRDLSKHVEMTPAKVHRYLVSLLRTGLVAQESDTGYYFIGEKAILLGLVGLRTLNVVRIAGEFLSRLSDLTGETATLALWTENGPVVVQFEESDRPVYMNIRVGSALPIVHTANGQIFAAYMPETKWKPKLRQVSVHKASARDVSQLKQQLPDIRQKGYAFVTGGLVPGVNALAAPVLNHADDIVAAIGILGRQEDFDDKGVRDLAGMVRDVADDFGRRLGAQA